MIRLETISYTDCTIGRLTSGSFQCFTLELPWLENQVNISCYPPGIYRYFKRISPNKGYGVIQLKDVPGRTYIQIHAGNFTKEIKGCVLVGDSIKFIDSDLIPDVTNSQIQLDLLLYEIPEEGTIEVIRHGAAFQ